MKEYSTFSKAPALQKPHHQIFLVLYSGHSLGELGEFYIKRTSCYYKEKIFRKYIPLVIVMEVTKVVYMSWEKTGVVTTVRISHLIVICALHIQKGVRFVLNYRVGGCLWRRASHVMIRETLEVILLRKKKKQQRKVGWKKQNYPHCREKKVIQVEKKKYFAWIFNE